MSTPLRNRKTCLPKTRKFLIRWYQKAKSLGYVDTQAKCAAMYIGNRLQQGGGNDSGLSKAIETLKRGNLYSRGGKETAEDFDRLTGGCYA